MALPLLGGTVPFLGTAALGSGALDTGADAPAGGATPVGPGPEEIDEERPLPARAGLVDVAAEGDVAGGVDGARPMLKSGGFDPGPPSP